MYFFISFSKLSIGIGMLVKKPTERVGSVLTPNIGSVYLSIILAVFKNVPSPPNDTTKSILSKSLGFNK